MPHVIPSAIIRITSQSNSDSDSRRIFNRANRATGKLVHGRHGCYPWTTSLDHVIPDCTICLRIEKAIGSSLLQPEGRNSLARARKPWEMVGEDREPRRRRHKRDAWSPFGCIQRTKIKALCGLARFSEELQARLHAFALQAVFLSRAKESIFRTNQAETVFGGILLR